MNLGKMKRLKEGCRETTVAVAKGGVDRREQRQIKIHLEVKWQLVIEIKGQRSKKVQKVQAWRSKDTRLQAPFFFFLPEVLNFL